MKRVFKTAIWVIYICVYTSNNNAKLIRNNFKITAIKNLNFRRIGIL